MTETAQRVAAWRETGRTGSSSKTMAAHLMGETVPSPSYPHDAADFGRCLALLDAVPEFRARIGEMAELSGYVGEVWGALAENWATLEELHGQMPESCTTAMKAILKPIEEASGRVVRLGGNASLHLPDNPLGNMMKEGMEISYAAAVKACVDAGEVTHTIIQRATGLNTEMQAQIIQRMTKDGLVEPTGKNGKLLLTKKAIQAIGIADKVQEIAEATGKPAAQVLDAAKKAVGIGHNSGEKAVDKQEEMMNQAKGTAEGEISGQRLKSFIERVERLEEEKRTLGEDVRDVYSEAKSQGFEPKIMRKIVALRRSNLEKRREEQEILDLYMAAIGMAE